MTTLDPAAVDALLARARRDVEDGLLPSCQIALGMDGKVVVHEAFGIASIDTRYTIYSATKPFVAAVIWQLIGEGSLEPARRVADVLPAFGTRGKDAVTLDHVLQHTSGFPRAPLGPPRWATHEGRAEAFSEWRLSWDAGTQYEYHPTSAHWVLAELIHAVTGMDHTDAVRTRVAEPLGLDGFALGVPVDEQDGIRDLVLCGEPATPDELEAALGIREIDVGEVTDQALVALNEPAARAVGLPGGGGVATAADVALFYQALLDDRAGLWDPVVLDDATTVVRNTFPDPMLGHPANRSRGLVLAGDDGRSNLRGMGRTVSPGTFGHNGAAGQIAWADPAMGLSFSYLTDGRDLNFLREHRRTTALGSLAGVCAA
ncbi:MAG: serine hydrolase domain-containing protein [Acidimicrobiales bacterium]|nr:serine hydrolase domain-containing protein [Acidimicrobiales bacterium]